MRATTEHRLPRRRTRALARGLVFLSCATVFLLLARPASYAWWDTQIRAQKSEPLVREFPAARCAGAKSIVEDKQADGGKGGKVAAVSPGEELSFEIELKHSCYSVWFIARAEEKDFKAPADPNQELELPGGKVRAKCPRPLVYLTLKVKSPDGSERSWYMPVAYRTDYAVVSKMYFPFHLDGRCVVTAGLDKRSQIGLLMDRFEVRDVLGRCARVAAKTKPLVSKRHEDAGKAAKLTDERKARNDALWDSLSDLNLMSADPGWQKWHQAIGRDARGKVLDQARKFEDSGAEEAGWDAAVLLCALAEKYPCLDHCYSEVSDYSVFCSADGPRWGSRDGKNVYSGWAGGDLIRLAQAYDKVHDFIAGNQALADYVHTKMAWVKGPKDLIELVDTNILQHGVDCLNRRIIRDDLAAAWLPLIQGVNEVSKKMLEGGLFNAIHENMADAGGLDDQAFTSFSRGGVHYIGSTLYVGPALEEIAGVLKQYRDAGGDPKFDLSDRALYPHMAEAAYTKHALHAAGGFPIIIGDAMDLSRPREAHPSYPSRVLEGFGAAVLEDGQDQANPRVKRAVGTHTGLGRGHSHQDQLNLELFAHGVRLLPDLGGRHEGKNRSSPNMRTNRMHNLVWVDRKEFTNVFPGSTCDATGWTTAFSPQPGAQYMASSARATSHPQVPLYQRATAMVDGAVSADDADVYLFDVFRVRGGKEHVYCFHGAYSEKVEANVELRSAQSEEAKALLAGRPEASRQEGVAGDALEVTWPLRQDMQKRHQAEAYQPDRPVAVTLALLGHGGEKLYLGGASSKVYPVDMPYLHVQRKQDAEGLVSVYPVIVEAHAGGRFIAGKKLLKVTPAAADDAGAGVAVAVKLVNGRKDLCFSSLKPAVEHEVEDGAKVAGEFGFLSEDDQGLCAAHLVGGTTLRRGGVGIACERAAYEAVIESVDYPNRTLKLSAALPAKLLDGAVALIGNDEHWEAFQLATVSGKTATVVRTPRYYQSKVVAVDGQKSLVETELEPMVYGCDTRYCNGTTVTNEAHDRFWKAKLEPKERWMYLGWPNTRLSYPTEVRMEDLPDADGDGRRVLKMLGSGGVNDYKVREAKDQAVLELEVTRVDPANHIFHFKMPDAPKSDQETEYRVGGWQYANRILTNEDGSKRWWATYPGITFSWELKGKEPVSDAAFTDADGDGKRKLYAYHFGPGDALRLNTFVYLRRAAPGIFEVRANVPCTLALPLKGEVEISRSHADYAPHASRKTGDSLEIALSLEDLGAGAVRIRQKP